MRHLVRASIVGICFVVCSASALSPKTVFSPRQQAATTTPQTATDATSDSAVDFELKIIPAKGFFVRRKGTSEWVESSKLNEPVVVGLLDGKSKIYAPSRAITPPKAKHTEPPDYPENERRAAHNGRAVLHVIVDDQGIVRLPTVDASPSPQFAKAAIDAVKKWNFKPASLNGQPIAVLVRIEMEFGLY